MPVIKVKLYFCFFVLILMAGCQQMGVKTADPAALRNVPAQKLSYSFEPDALPPVETETPASEEKAAAVQADFDQNRPEELLDRTVPSPDRQRILAVYHRAADIQTEFRLDMYGADGKLLQKISPDAMAISLPDSITWSPDSGTVAFVGVARAQPQQSQAQAQPPADAPTPPEVETNSNTANAASTDANFVANGDGNANATVNANANTATPTPAAPTSAPIKLFANEQVYTSNKDGVDLKYISQKDTLIYFYLLWSPDSTMLATLACTPAEWQYGELYAKTKAEIFRPFGRPRLIEKIGRERLLDDNLTVVYPAWSPDSAKVSYAFDKDVKIYDTVGDTPTYAVIPLRVPLLTSSQRYDQTLLEQEKGANTANANTNAPAPPANAPAPIPAPPANQGVQVMPNEADLVSFNPVVELRWTEEKIVYLKTGYIKEMLDSRYSSYSYMRWHKITLSGQAAAAAR